MKLRRVQALFPPPIINTALGYATNEPTLVAEPGLGDAAAHLHISISQLNRVNIRHLPITISPPLSIHYSN